MAEAAEGTTAEGAEDVSTRDFESTDAGKDPSESETEAFSRHQQSSRDSSPPPPALPPRPRQLSRTGRSPFGSLSRPSTAGGPGLSRATTAVSRADIQVKSHGEDHSKSFSPPGSRRPSRQPSFSNLGRFVSNGKSDGGDSASIRSYIPTLETSGDVESLLGEVLSDFASPAWKKLDAKAFEQSGYFEDITDENDSLNEIFAGEFEDLDSFAPDGSNEETLMIQFRSKLKHFLILSSAGKPIYSRHGDEQLVSNYIGVVQTIISFYQGAKDNLKGFTAGGARFVVMSKGPLNLVAISRLGESDYQLRVQLEALYMQILSTLTLPSMERMFSNRPSTDLRRPLEGTDTLLSSLADGFTRGSPSALLSALECLRLRKTHRQVINNTMLKVKTQNLLYGLIVAGGKLVSVVRPKKHSLHPGDLQLIFNMLFEAKGVKAGGGENWIPICLPGFNNTGYLYMYVSFISAARPEEEIVERPSSRDKQDEEIAILFISPNKEGFYELRQMRDELVDVRKLRNTCRRPLTTKAT
ncbi:MAG: Vacuolar fusion protein mon1 [Bogoriella megaspora]|nr:MAG: Vacuolar fusion protein mon1 [Bogoriella megaspora]